MKNATIIDCITVGRIFRQTIVSLDRRIHERMLAGPVLYAAAGARSAMEHVGIISAVAATERESLSKMLASYKIDGSEVITSDGKTGVEQFLGYASPNAPASEQLIPFFAAMQMSLPQSLKAIEFEPSSRQNLPRYYPAAFSPFYYDVSAAHLCAAEVDHQVKVSTLLNKSAISVLTLRSHPASMIPANWEKMMNLMSGLTVFITTSAELSALFTNREIDLMDIAAILHKYGCEYLVLLQNAEGYLLMDLHTMKRHQIPVYPTEVIDPTGMDETFCGGLLAELRQSHDPIKAALRGSVVASIKGEGSGPFFLLDAMPGLIDARMARIQEWVKQL